MTGLTSEEALVLTEYLSAKDSSDLRGQVDQMATREAGLIEALVAIARHRTSLRGDFSMGSKQSDIARQALADAGLCVNCGGDLWTAPNGNTDCPSCNPDPTRG